MSRYVPALGFRALTRLYDPIAATLLRERSWKSALVRGLALRGDERVLDLGCGTGTLLLMLRHAHPRLRAVGLDGDPDVLALAREKAGRAGVDLALVRAFAQAPPFAPGSFDRITSSIALHHLAPAARREAFAAAWRLLAPGGMLLVADFGAPRSLAAWAAFMTVRVLDGFEPTADSAHGRYPRLLGDAGFSDVAEVARHATVAGVVSFYRGVRAG